MRELPPLRLPRQLLDPDRADLRPGADGLVAVRLRHHEGRITAIEPLAVPAAQALPLALTPLVEPHAHLDKAFSWPQATNLEGTMAAALAANLAEHGSRTAERVRQRAARALEQGWRYGLRAIRSHVDAHGAVARVSWEVLDELRQQWRDRITLQLVAMAPLAHWASAAGREQARRVAASGGLLGGALGPPFAAGPAERQALAQLLRVAEALGCGVDLHVDEADDAPGRGVAMVAALLQQQRPGVPVTCSHASSMGLLPSAACADLAERLAELAVTVVALPGTNHWLLSRSAGVTPTRRPLAPIRQLQRAGVVVAVGGDNVQDPWFPGGDGDPLETLRQAVPSAQLHPWRRQDLAAFTTGPARLLGLPWDGVLRPGAPADLVVLAVSGWPELLGASPQRRVLRGGRWLPPPVSPPLAAMLEQAAAGG